MIHSDDFRPRREKKNTPKVKQTKRVAPRESFHARERAIQRYGYYIKNDGEIVRQIESGVACRLCALPGGSKGLYIVRLGPNPAFVVYDEASRVVITFLPPGRDDYRLVQAMADVIVSQREHIHRLQARPQTP